MRDLPSLGLALALAACGCRSASTAPAEGQKGVPVETVAVATEDVAVTVEAVGTLRPDQVVEVMPKRPGHVRELHLTEGAQVEQGALLVVLDDDDVRARVEQARAGVADARVRERNTRRQYERTAALLKEGIAARQAYDDVKAELDRGVAGLAVAEANLAFAEAELAETVIRAPFTGVLGQRRVDRGAFVNDGQAIVSLVDLDPMEVVFAVPERYLAKLRIGQAVEATVVSHGDRRFPGSVGFVDPQVDPVNRTVTLKATLPNADHALHPGQFTAVTLQLDRHPNAPVIPEEALVPDGNRTLVYVVQDGTATARPVQTGIRLPGRVEVLTGVVAGETIVRTGHEKLRADGTQSVVDVTGQTAG